MQKVLRLGKIVLSEKKNNFNLILHNTRFTIQNRMKYKSSKTEFTF